MMPRSNGDSWDLGFHCGRLLRGAALRCALAGMLVCSACSTDRSAETLASKSATSERADQRHKGLERGGDTPGEGWIRKLEGAHAKADLAVSTEQQFAARSELEKLLDTAPRDQSPGAVWVRQDMLARLAALDLAVNDPRRAVERAAQGLSLSAETSLPAANLLMVQGKALEQLGDKAQAVKVYHRALVMNEELMKRSLEGH